MAGPCIADTNCIDLSVNGDGNLIADIILDPAGGLACGAPGLALKIADTNCIDLSINGGGNLTATTLLDPAGGLACGAPGLALKIDPNPCNDAITTGSGLYVRKQTTDVFSTGALVGIGATGVSVNFLGVGIDLDAWVGAYGTGVQNVVQGSDLSYTNTTCRNVNVRVAWKVGPVAICLCNGWWFAVGSLNSITSPPLTGSAGPAVFLSTADSPLADGTTLSTCAGPAEYQEVFFLAPGQSAACSITIFAQAIVAGPPSGTATPNGVQVYFGQTIEMECWTA